MKKSRAIGFATIAVIYIVAAVIGVTLYRYFIDYHLFLKILIADVGATVFVFITGVVLRNASVYDPYWSVAPPVIFIGLAYPFTDLSPGLILLLAAVWFWGVRLTINWARTFINLGTQDWRYDMFMGRYPRMFQVVSFFGINLFPTIVVYLCMLPGISFIESSAFNVFTVLGFLVCVSAATLQLIADMQMHRFRRDNTIHGSIIRTGLWKYARHPNYLGEIMMWWGVYIIMLSSSPGTWFLIVGPLVNTLMFLGVSIPMADSRNRDLRPGFDEYVKETNSLLPLRFRNQ